MKLKPITNKGKDLIGGRAYTLYEFREKVICLDNQPGYLFVSTEGKWSGLWIKKDNDPNFKLIEEEEICTKI